MIFKKFRDKEREILFKDKIEKWFTFPMAKYDSTMLCSAQ